MNFKKNVFFVIFVFMLCFFLPFTGPAHSQQCNIVRIAKETHNNTTRIYLFPQELRISQGSCVIWISWVKTDKVSVNFKESLKTCTIGSEFASGFMKKKECFLTDFLSYGQTVSILFNEKGIFAYQIEMPEASLDKDRSPGRKLVREGKIIVE